MQIPVEAEQYDYITKYLDTTATCDHVTQCTKSTVVDKVFVGEICSAKCTRADVVEQMISARFV